MIVIGLDPGPEQSAIVSWDGISIGGTHLRSNAEMLRLLVLTEMSAIREARSDCVLVIEKIEGFGMPAGATTFETVFWSGRFAQAWGGQFDRLGRKAIKLHLCGTTRANDANIRQAIVDRFGPSKEKAIGVKSARGPLYGLKGHLYAALAVALTWHDLHGAETENH